METLVLLIPPILSPDNFQPCFYFHIKIIFRAKALFLSKDQLWPHFKSYTRAIRGEEEHPNRRSIHNGFLEHPRILSHLAFRHKCFGVKSGPSREIHIESGEQGRSKRQHEIRVTLWEVREPCQASSAYVPGDILAIYETCKTSVCMLWINVR